MSDAIGALRERLVIQNGAPATLSLASLTRSGAVATAATVLAHGYATNDYVTVAGASVAGYNGRVKITVTGTRTFTYSVSVALASPAVGTMTVVYTSDAQGGRRVTWATFATIHAEMIPLKADERLQFLAVQSDVIYRFRTRRRIDLTPKMRALWTPRWPRQAPTETLEINGVIPEDLAFMFLECARSPAA